MTDLLILLAIPLAFIIMTVFGMVSIAMAWDHICKYRSEVELEEIEEIIRLNNENSDINTTGTDTD